MQRLDAALEELDLRDWDKGFLSDMLQRLRGAAAPATISEKQYAQLERILQDQPDRAVRDDAPPNGFPYESEGGTAYYQKRAYDPKRKRK